MTDSQMYTPLELSIDWTVAFNKNSFVGRHALLEEKARGPRRRTVGLVVNWPAVVKLYRDAGLPPLPPQIPTHEKIPLYSGTRQVGRATSTCWAPLVKQYIAIATVQAPFSALGTLLDFEVTVEGERKRAPATVVKRPFYDPAHKKG